MKHSILRIAAVMAAIVCTAIAAAASGDVNKRTIVADLVNSATGQNITDTIKVEVLAPDSTVLVTATPVVDYRRSYNPGDILNYCIQVNVPSEGDDVILRLSHPDYATAVYPAKLKGWYNDLGVLRMRRLTRYEKGLMLGEVVVKTSVLQVVHKGDTLQYNADAFAVAQGSMLDALVEQLPGVELRDGGQIYVNGRFVEKLLLDGKDFFQGDKFVLLQNLPAYTVKNIKVYEKASLRAEVMGKGAAGSDENSYVMDVTLKKDYNAGWLANAEAGAGTHSRYRGRAFGMGYTSNLRLGAYGLINNMNETRNPGRDGSWNPKDALSGVAVTKSGGLNYNYYRPDRTIELDGAASAKYSKLDNNSLVNRQNFLAGGDTYTRRWSDYTNRDVELHTDHNMTIRPKEGNKYNHSLSLQVDYATARNRANTTEGTFGRNIGDRPELRSLLQADWVANADAINRYLELRGFRTKRLSGKLSWYTNLALPANAGGLFIVGSGNYSRLTDGDSRFSDILLQYAGQDAQTTSRENPQRNHNYQYNLAIEWSKNIGQRSSTFARVDYFNNYEYRSNAWYTTDRPDADHSDAVRAEPLPSVRMASALLFDPANSYVTGKRFSAVRPRIGYVFIDRQGSDMTKIRLQIEGTAVRNHLDYTGPERQRVKQNYFKPVAMLSFEQSLDEWTHNIRGFYEFRAHDNDMFNLLDLTLTSDPLNIRRGNPALKRAFTQSGNIDYSINGWLWERFMTGTGVSFKLVQRDDAMASSYDRATGVRTWMPVNVNGNFFGQFYFNPTVALDRGKRLLLRLRTSLSLRRSVDMASTDGFATSEKSVVKTGIYSQYGSLTWSVSRFSASILGEVNTQRVWSASNMFTAFRVTDFKYGFNGRVKLPAGFDISTDLQMYSTRGYDDPAMNVNQLVWNARLTKSLAGGKILLSADGYDMLRRVKNITYSVNAQGRTETWVNTIPSYFMFSLRWNFAKKPRQ